MFSIVTITDKTKNIYKLMKMNEMLQKIANEQAILLNTIPAMIFWIDKKGDFIRVNKAFASAFHKSPNEIKGKSLFDSYPEDMAMKY